MVVQWLNRGVRSEREERSRKGSKEETDEGETYGSGGEKETLARPVGRVGGRNGRRF